MRRVFSFRVLGIAGFLILSCSIHASPNPGEVDSFTLLLASFEEDPQRADYANGWDEFAGSGAQLTDGYFGKGINLRTLQHYPENYSESAALTSFFNYWGFWPRGNIENEEGTFEFWFKVGETDQVINHPGQNLFFFHYFQPLRSAVGKDGQSEPAQPYIALTRNLLAWRLVTLSGDIVEGSVALNRLPGFNGLDPEDWHHLALTWASGELVFYLDGRILATNDLSGKGGIAWVAASHRDIAINGILMDELRVSSIARYRNQFEPPWRNGVRPYHAFNGNPTVERFHAEYRQPYRPSAIELGSRIQTLEWVGAGRRVVFDKQNGSLREPWQSGGDTRAGLLIWDGYNREPIETLDVSFTDVTAERLLFRQNWSDDLVVEHELNNVGSDQLEWKLSLHNEGEGKRLLETVMALAAPWRETVEYFDGSWVQSQLDWPRRRDHFVGTLPAVTAASDDGRWFLLGLDPRQMVSSLISEWVPAEGTGGQIRQGTRVVLNPGETQTLKFVLALGEGQHGALEGLAAFHELAPELYRQDPEIPIYSYLPVAHFFEHIYSPDLARQTYCGNQWGHGPSHTKGDEWGTAEWWDNPNLEGRFDYQHAQSMQETWKSIERMRQQQLWRHQYSYDYTYTPRRYHYVPNLTPEFIVEALWPNYQPEDDPLVAGQYYYPISGNLIVNEYQNPLGAHFIEQSVNLINHIGEYCPGFINDMAQTAPYRHNDSSIEGIPGRAFAPDRGEYVVGAFGHVDRYAAIESQVINGHRMSVWSDGGVGSYLLAAHSAANVIEGGAHLNYFTGPGQMYVPGRYMLGEKPLAVHSPEGKDWLGKSFRPEDFTAAQLRNFYRYNFRQIFLFSLDHGIYLDATYVQGKQWLAENNPILVESISSGRQILPAAEVDAPLWVRRGGRQESSILTVANQTGYEHTSPVRLFNSYYGQGAPVFGRYFGGALKINSVSEGRSLIEPITVNARDLEAFRLVGWIDGAMQSVDTSWQGTGLSFTVTIRVEGEGLMRFRPQLFAPIYELSTVTRNGSAVESPAEEGFVIKEGELLKLTYTTPWFDFQQDEWESMDLVTNDGRKNFVLIGETKDGYDNGTVTLLNQFLLQYDEEDGIVGTVTEAAVVSDAKHIPAGYKGWKIHFDPEQNQLSHGRVSIDEEASSVFIEAPHSGEMRRTTILFLRMLDRKYPHVGRLLPLRKRSLAFAQSKPMLIDETDESPWKTWFRGSASDTASFFENFQDPAFLKKPLLKDEYEGLYQGRNLDFRARYRVRFSPYLFEPTFPDSFVYGYGENKESGSAAD